MIIFYSNLALGAFLISLLGTRLMILAQRKKNAALNVPGVRSRQAVLMPRNGGLAMVVAILIFLLPANASYHLLLGVLLLTAVSLLDTWIPLALPTRLCVQVMAALVALHDVRLPMLCAALPHGLAGALIITAWVCFINLFARMEKIDGLASAEMVSISGGVIVITALLGTFTSPLSLLALIVLGAGFGFLWWNWHPAKILLDEVGSVPIGYLLGYLLLMCAKEGYVYAALILPAYCVADGAITLLLSAIKRQWIGNFYQRAVRGGLRQDAMVIIIFGINMLLAMLAALAELDPKLGWMYLSIAYGMVSAVMFFFLAHPKAARKAAP